jgi:amidase
LPISLKDLFCVKGYDATLGFVAWANHPAEKESELVLILRNLGAVLYCKTNVPTAMMMAETYNNLFGRTVGIS